MILGRIDEVDGHFIATRFLAFTIPTECVYVARDGASSKKKTGAHSHHTIASDGVRIQTDWRSVAFAYARVWGPILAIAAPIGSFFTTGALPPIPLFVLSAVLIVLAVLAFRSGRLPEKEKVRLRLLGSITGLRIDPAKLTPSMREVKRDSLGKLMEKGGIPTTPHEIVSVIDDIPMPAMPLVYGYACYAGDDQAWRECAALVYQRHEQGDI